MQPSAFERDEPRLIERPQGAAAALLRDATQAGSQPAGPSHSHGSASSSALGASAGAQMYLCGGACGSMLEMTAFSKAQLKKLRKCGQGSCITCTEAAERMRQHTIPLSEEEARKKRQKIQAVHAHKTLICTKHAVQATGNWQAAADLMGHGPGVSQRRQEHMQLSTELRTDNLMGEVMAAGVGMEVGQVVRVKTPVSGDCGATQGEVVMVGIALMVGKRIPRELLSCRLGRALEELLRVAHTFNHQLVRAGQYYALGKCGEKQTHDDMRGNFRIGVGYAELCCNGHKAFAGVPQESQAPHMWLPRQSAATTYYFRVLEELLPLLSACFDAADAAHPDHRFLKRITQQVGGLRFPHNVEVVVDEETGRPELQPKDPRHKLACSCMHRLSVLVAESKEAFEDTLQSSFFEGLLTADRHGKYRNAGGGGSILHKDGRDCGLDASLANGSEAKLAEAKVRMVKGSEVRDGDGNLPPLGAAVEHKPLHQIVVIISYGCAEHEAFAIVGLDRSSIVATLLSSPPLRAEEEGIRISIYMCDFSARWHGNPRSIQELPPRSWAIRLTPYATCHGATWWERARHMRPQDARQFLGAVGGVPGFRAPSCLMAAETVPAGEALVEGAHGSMARFEELGPRNRAQPDRFRPDKCGGQAGPSSLGAPAPSGCSSPELSAEELEERERVGGEEATTAEWDGFMKGAGSLCLVCGDGKEGGQNEMVLCDGSHFDWRHGIHVQCVRDSREHDALKKALAEPGEWYCPVCRKDHGGQVAYSHCHLPKEAASKSEAVAASAARYDRWRAGSTLIESAKQALEQCVPGAQILLGDDAGHLERRLVVECDNQGMCPCRQILPQGQVCAHLAPCWPSSGADPVVAPKSTYWRVFDPRERPDPAEVRLVPDPSVLDA